VDSHLDVFGAFHLPVKLLSRIFSTASTRNAAKLPCVSLYNELVVLCLTSSRQSTVYTQDNYLSAISPEPCCPYES